MKFTARLLLSVACLCCIWTAKAQSATARLPNILFVMVDDMGWMDSQVYGSTYYQTPSINRLADEGIRFTNASTANPLCSPTRASILTGQYPGRLQFTAASGHLAGHKLEASVPATNGSQFKATVPESLNRLKLEYHTLAEELKSAGYRTGFVGKWHMGHDPYIPENQGFDFVVGGREHPGPPPPGHFFAPWNLDTLPPATPGEHISDVTTTAAIEFIRENTDQPFFLCHWFYDVHAPFQSKPDLKEKYQKPLKASDLQRSPTMGGMLEVMDQNLGRLLDALEAAGIADNTIVIFTSDNGGNMYDTVDGTTPTHNAPLRSGKGNNYEGGVRVPLIVRWPARFEGGEVSDAMVSSVDYYPTLLELIGRPLRPQDHIDGMSFVPALEGKPHDRGPILSHFPHYVPATDNISNTSVHHGDWKLYRFWWDGPDQEHRYELYNLKEDIGESHNLASRYPEKVRELDAVIDTYVAEAGFLAPAKNPRFGQAKTDGWNEEGTSRLSLGKGVLIVNSTGNDPYITHNDVPAIEGPFQVQVRIRGTVAGASQLFWRTRDFTSYHEGASILRTFRKDGTWQTLVFPVSDTGTLQGLRFDPAQDRGKLEIDWIRIQKDGLVKKEWDFSGAGSDENVEGWKKGGTAHLSKKEGAMVLTSTGKDPFLTTSLAAPLAGPVTLRFRMSSTASGEGQVFWKEQPSQPFHRDRSLPFTVRHDGSPHDYEVQLPRTVHALRIDPARGEGEIEFERISLTPANGPERPVWDF
jgi:arylsulfatase A-like enzyme